MGEIEPHGRNSFVDQGFLATFADLVSHWQIDVQAYPNLKTLAQAMQAAIQDYYDWDELSQAA